MGGDEVSRLEAALRAKLGWAAKTRSGDRVFINTVCPVCGRKKLSVNAATGRYRCWRECGSGDVRSLLKGFTFTPAKTSPAPAPETLRYISPGTVVKLSSLPGDHEAVTYLLRRGFDPTYLERVFGAAYCEDGEVFARGRYNTTGTLLFPVRKNGVLVAWQSRLLYDPDALSESECRRRGMVSDPESGKLMRFPKYFTMPGLRKGEMLFNFDNACESEAVAVVEGVFDVFGAGKCAVACFGKGVSDAQVGMIASRWRLALLMLDPGTAEETGKLRSRLLVRGVTPVVVPIPEGWDCGSMPRTRIWELAAEAAKKEGIDLCRWKINL